nr:arginine/serine-rich coiled-coil protein 2-like [Halyomorpha halys]
MDKYRLGRKDSREREWRRSDRKNSRSRSRSPPRYREYRDSEINRDKDRFDRNIRDKGREKLSVLAKLGIRLELPERGSQKILWSKSTVNNWEGANFGDGRTTAKFQRLMGMKESVPEVAKEDCLEKQEVMFKQMEAEYETARMVTHTQRRAGLGFSKAV